jgi:hypothetical protein
VATLIVIIHEFDVFRVRDRVSGKVDSPYLLFEVLRQLEALGHSAVISRGPRTPRGDAALLHVDSTIVEPEYLALARHYPLAINFRTGDISKRATSRLLLSRDDRWDGPVMVKSNYNNNAVMEDLHNRGAAKTGQPLPHPGVTRGGAYSVLESISDVGDDIWSDPSLVVERFLPEPDPEGGFVLRTWVFMGARERCTRFVTADKVSKAADILRSQPIEVPPKLRAERERLGFDFGKFDWVMHDGEPVLLDANRTPGVATAIQALMKEGARNLAEGLHGLLTGKTATVKALP